MKGKGAAAAEAASTEIIIIIGEIYLIGVRCNESSYGQSDDCAAK